jgi:hypothetical protein
VEFLERPFQVNASRRVPVPLALRKTQVASGDRRAFRYAVEFSKETMGLDPQTQGDARTKKHADVCNGYLPTELASEEERKMGCAECCDCWCHFNFSNEDGTESGRRRGIAR